MLHLLLVSLPLLSGQDEKPKPPYEATVTVQEAVVRAGTSSLSKIVATLKLRDKVTVLEIQKGVARVKLADGREGWISERSILDSPTYLSKEQAAGGDPSAGAESHAYAKGFDPETESKLRSSEGLDAQYAQVDRLESMAFRKDAQTLAGKLEAFRKAGGLGEFRR